MISWPSTVISLALEAIMLGLAAVVATRVAGALLPESADALERGGVAAMVGVTGWVALLQVLGLAGILWVPVVIGCLVVMAFACVRYLPRRPSEHRNGPPIPWVAVAVAIPFCVLAVAEVASVQPGLYFSDSLRYHIPNAAEILYSGSIRGLPFAQPGDGSAASPGNGSLLLLAVMLALHTDALVGVVGLCCAGLLIAVVAMLCRELGQSAWVGAGCGLIIVTTWAFFGTQIASAYDDVVGLLGLVTGITFGLRYARTAQLRWLVIAGAGIGLALGTKGVDMLPGLAVAASVALLARLWRRPGPSAVFVAACLSISLVWWVRDWVVTGNPLFPETIALGRTVIFPGVGGPSPQGAGTSVIGAILGGQGVSLSAWLRVGLLSFGPALATLFLCLPLAWRRGGAPRVIALLGVACVAAYAVTPFTGSAYYLAGAMRYLFPGILFSLVSVATVAPQRWLRPSIALSLAFNAIVLPITAWVAGFPVAVFWATAAASLLLLAAVQARQLLVPLTRLRWIRGGTAVASAVLVVLATGNLQPSQAPTPVDRALATAGDPTSAVVVMNVYDVTAILGPELNVNIVAAGEGPVGAETPVGDPEQLTLRIDSLHPAAVVVGTGSLVDSIPPGWKPPATWRRLGTEAGAMVYEP